MAHPLSHLLRRLEQGEYPPWDGETELMPSPVGARAVVLAFTGHNVVAADLDQWWIREWCPTGDLVAPVRGGFLHELARRVSGVQGPLDLVLMASGLSGPPPLKLDRLDDGSDHARVRRAMRVRTNVTAYVTPGESAVLSVGRGLAGRWEAGFEVEPEFRDQGLGRAVAGAARHLVPAGHTIYMQVAAGNTASIRAVLAAGFAPVGAEILFNAGENPANL